MKATRPNQEHRRGRSSSPEASRRGQRPLARYLTPGLPRRRAPCGVNFPPAEGGRTTRTLENPSSSRSCHWRPATGPPRSIHNLRPWRLQPVEPPTGLPEAKARRRSGPGCGTEAPQGCGLAPSPETAMHHGSGVGAARLPEATPRPPRAPPYAHAPSPQPRQLGLGPARGLEACSPPQPAAPPRRRRGTGSRHTRRCPPCSTRPAPGR